MANFQNLRATDLYNSRQKDPVITLWRSVLTVAIEDAIKMKKIRMRNWQFYKDKICPEIDYVIQPNHDFATICHYSDLDHNLVRKKVIKTLNKIEESDGKTNMPKVPWERLYQINWGGQTKQSDDTNDSAMPTLQVAG